MKKQVPSNLEKSKKNQSHPTWKSGKVSDKLYKTSAEAPVAASVHAPALAAGLIALGAAVPATRRWFVRFVWPVVSVPVHCELYFGFSEHCQ